MTADSANSSSINHLTPDSGSGPSQYRWPGIRAVLGCGLAGAVAVATDAYFNVQEGYLARPPDYDGVSYVVYARQALLLLRDLHLKAGLRDLLTGISPLWVSLMTAQQLILGDGTWQAFTARFWAVALILLLVYWIVRRRATRTLAIAAVTLTALLPLVSAGVRASSWEFVTGQSDYFEHWFLDDVRPDLFTYALALWAVGVLVEHIAAPRRSAYLISAAFAAAAVLSKTSTTPIIFSMWGLALIINWVSNRRSVESTRMSLIAAAFMLLLLVPWAVFAGGAQTVVSYLRAVVAFQSDYSRPGGALLGLMYYLDQIPNQLGQVEAWPVIIGVLLLAVVLVRRRLGPAEVAYASVAVLLYGVLSLTPSKNPVVGVGISLSVWIFFWATASRVLATRWPQRLERASPAVLAAVAMYTFVVYGLGLGALANWPANERDTAVQQSAVTNDVAHELSRHLTTAQCFTYVPGPGWPNSILYQLMDANGRVPGTTALDINPAVTTVSDYVASAARCTAVLTYRENISYVAKEFFAPPVRQPYLQAVADWVRSPGSGYNLDRTWRFTDLAPGAPHRLGHYEGISLTLDLYLRGSSP